METLAIGDMRRKIRQVIEERDWGRYQTPKNLAISLSIEASELMEIFQWLTDEEAAKIKDDPKKMQEVRDELADVLYWLVHIADVLSVDLNAAFWAKMQKNIEKYPVDLSKGKSTKYDQL